MRVLAASLALCIAGGGWGPSEADIERARVLYDNGRTLYAEGSWDGAILAFEQAYELSGDINLLYNISLCHDRKGDYAQAIEYLDRYRALAPEEERGKLEERRAVLEARLSKQREDEAAAAAAEPEPELDDTEPQPQRDDDRSKPRVFGPAAAALTAVAVAGWAVGIGFGVSSLQGTRAAEDGCGDGLCMDAVRDDVRRSRTHAIGADVGFAIGAAATLALVVVIAVKAVRIKKETPRVSATPGGFRF
jgi:tetratricopeptide (TPR) repeat protein